MLSLFDLHCDMPTEAHQRRISIRDDSLMASACKASAFDTYVQVAAVWSDCRLCNEDAYLRYLAVRDDFTRQAEENGYALLRRAADIRPHRVQYVLAVEDARVLCGDLSRLTGLYEDGVRFLTLVWAGESIIGGAFDTAAPLTPFGRQVVEECFRLGITPDLSHASDTVVDEVLDMAERHGKAVVATHSNSRTVFPHPRNLTDTAFRRIAALGGMVGISMAPQHLTDGDCDARSVLTHIRHYLALGGEHAVGFGCDFDGISKTPHSLEDPAALPRFAELMADDGIPEETIHRIFYQNARELFERVAL